MSMFPDCRNDAYYNEDFLNRDGMNNIMGYDDCVDAANNFFDNLDTYFGTDSVMGELLNRKLLHEGEETYIVRGLDGEDKEEKIMTYGDILRAKLLAWLEMQRDEIITSMLDAMDEDEYNKLRTAALNSNKEKENPKEYYDTKKYAVSGIKEFVDETSDD